MNTDEKDEGVYGLGITHPAPGAKIHRTVMPPHTVECKGDADASVIKVYGLIYDASGSVTIPATPPTNDPNLGEVTPAAGGSWTIDLPFTCSSSPGTQNLLVAWYQYPMNSPMPWERHATFFLGIQD